MIDPPTHPPTHPPTYIQGDDDAGGGGEMCDLDAYTERLEAILERKMELIGDLRGKLQGFRARLLEEK